MTKKFDHETFDITEPMARYTIKELIKLFILLDENGYDKTYFDGYNASIEVFKSEVKK